MTFRIRHDGPRIGGPYEREVWLVEKVSGTDAWLLASFDQPAPATATLAMLSGTIEVANGAAVEFEHFTINAK